MTAIPYPVCYGNILISEVSQFQILQRTGLRHSHIVYPLMIYLLSY